MTRRMDHAPVESRTKSPGRSLAPSCRPLALDRRVCSGSGFLKKTKKTPLREFPGAALQGDGGRGVGSLDCARDFGTRLGRRVTASTSTARCCASLHGAALRMTRFGRDVGEADSFSAFEIRGREVSQAVLRGEDVIAALKRCATKISSLRKPTLLRNSVVPPRLESFFSVYPAPRRWANVGRPSGAGILAVRFHRPARKVSFVTASEAPGYRQPPLRGSIKILLAPTACVLRQAQGGLHS